MRRLDRHCPDLPLFDVAHTRRIEAAALAPLPAHALMQRAGAAVARLALALAPHANLIRIVAGTGNNGGDGIDAAIRLQHAGKAVEVILLGEPQADDARDALARAHDAGVPPARMAEMQAAIADNRNSNVDANGGGSPGGDKKADASAVWARARANVYPNQTK